MKRKKVNCPIHPDWRLSANLGVIKKNTLEKDFLIQVPKITCIYENHKAFHSIPVPRARALG
jgi:hypothetical protein